MAITSLARFLSVACLLSVTLVTKAAILDFSSGTNEYLGCPSSSDPHSPRYGSTPYPEYCTNQRVYSQEGFQTYGLSSPGFDESHPQDVLSGGTQYYLYSYPSEYYWNLISIEVIYNPGIISVCSSGKGTDFNPFCQDISGDGKINFGTEFQNIYSIANIEITECIQPDCQMVLDNIEVEAVPIPATLLLFVSGILGLNAQWFFGGRRSRNTKNKWIGKITATPLHIKAEN